MSQLIVKKMMSQLPHRKNTIISKRLIGISPIQVKCVLNGSITNPDIVKPVLKEARKLLKQSILISRKYSYKKTA